MRLFASTRPRTVAIFGIAAVAAVCLGALLLARDEPGSAPTGDFTLGRSPRSARDEPVARGRGASGRGGGDTVLMERRAAADDASRPERVPGQLIVRFEPGVPLAQREATLAAAGATRVRSLPIPGAEVVRLRPGVTESKARAQLETSPLVVYSEPDHVYRAAAVDPRDQDVWALGTTATGRIRAPEAWAIGTGSRDIRVAVVDTGVAMSHPDLAPNLWVNPGETGSGRESNARDDDGTGYVDDWRGWDWVPGSTLPSDLRGHGTHVAGTIGAARNGAGVTGINWNVSIMALRALDATGAGTTSEIAAAFDYAADMGAEVVNASLGGSGSSRTLLETIRAHPDTLFVVAAGNEGADNDAIPSYPCNYDAANIVCVAATDINDALASFSNVGATNVDLAAPGVRILSDAPALATVYRETFDAGFGGRWVVEGSGAAWTVASDNLGAYASDGPGSYAPGADAWIRTQDPIDLSAFRRCYLSFAVRAETEVNRDTLSLEWSPDKQTWRSLRSWTGSTNGAWIQAGVEVWGGEPMFLRFRIQADTNEIVGAGADVDDLVMECAADSYTGTEYKYASGTSMATPHVAGAAALLWGIIPDASATRIKDLLLQGTTPVPALAGKTVTGGRVDVYRALEIAGVATSTTLRPQNDVALPASSPTPIAASPTPAVAEPAPPPAAPAPVDEPATPVPAPSPSGELAPPPPASMPEATPTPVAAPAPAPTPAPVATVSRQLSLTLARHLIARGQLTTDAPSATCSSAIVKLFRNDVLIDARRTAPDGTYSFRIADRKGRYRTHVRRTAECSAAGSVVWRHRHTDGGPASVPVGQVAGATEATSCGSNTDPLETALARATGDGAPLTLDEDLAEVATLHSLEMAQQQVAYGTETEALRARVTGWTSLAEVAGAGDDPLAVFEELLRRNRDQLVGGSFTHAGIGVIEDADHAWVTLLVASGDDPGTTLNASGCTRVR